MCKFAWFGMYEKITYFYKYSIFSSQKWLYKQFASTSRTSINFGNKTIQFFSLWVIWKFSFFILFWSIQSMDLSQFVFLFYIDIIAKFVALLFTILIAFIAMTETKQECKYSFDEKFLQKTFFFVASVCSLIYNLFVKGEKIIVAKISNKAIQYEKCRVVKTFHW